MNKEIFTLKEAANYLRLSKSCLYKKTSKKEITYHKPGGKLIYFTKDDLDKWLLSSRVHSVKEEIESFENGLSNNTETSLI